MNIFLKFVHSIFIFCLVFLPLKTLPSSTFLPTYSITHQTCPDKKLIAELEPFIVDGSYDATNIQQVRTHCINTLQAQKVVLCTNDNKQLAALYFSRPNAQYSLICINGYLLQATPPKEWAATIAYLFPNANVLLFDWRGLGESPGYNGFYWKNDFGTDAWLDIQAAIDFCDKKSNKPIVTLGFCLGAGMLLYAIQQASLFRFRQPDAIIINGLFDQFEHILQRIGEFYAMPFYSFLVSIGLGNYVLDQLLSGSLSVLNPIDLISRIKQPILLQLLANDPFIPLQEGLAVYRNIISYKELCISSVGKHVRLQHYAPAQFRHTINTFLSTTLALAPAFQDHAAV